MMFLRLKHAQALAGGVVVWFSLAHARAAEPARVDFSRDVQPIFAGRCYECHGAQKQKSDFRLDDRATALHGGESGKPALVPGKSSASGLYQRILSRNPDDMMPPKGERLAAAQIALLKTWIDQGATWPDEMARPNGAASVKHWAFQPPVRPPLPPVRRGRWVRDPIDSFVLARLEREKLKPSPEADKVTFLRRLSLDLIGLPPTIAELDAFEADKSKDAGQKQVERLLASPHYGERWARVWLDAARYADSDGFEKDKPRFVWNYRDWVIRAFNRDLPYNEFIIEQMAGDLLPHPTQDQRIATGFLRNSMLNEEGGVDPEQFRMDAMFDRMDAIGKSILGLTIQCAQCHNHKFDPLTQEEYYRMFAYLNNDHEASMIAYTPKEEELRSNLLRQMRDLEQGLRHSTAGWQERMNAWEDSVSNNQPAWVTLACQNAGDNGERYYYFADNSIRAASYAPTKWTAVFKTTNAIRSIGAFRLEQLTDADLPCNGPGRSIKGMSALSEFRVGAADAKNPTNKYEVKLVKATADYSNPEKPLEPEFDDRSGANRVYGPVEFAIDGNGDTAWGIDAGPGRRNQPRQAVFVPDKPVAFSNGVILTFSLMQNHGGWNSDDNQNHNLGRFRLSVTAVTNAVADPIPPAVREIFRIPRERRSPAQVATVFSYWRTTVPEFKDVNTKIEALWRQWPEGSPTLALVARFDRNASDFRRPTHMLSRGDWLKPGREVTAGVPAFLNPLPPGAGQSRLGLARWMVDRRAPTTARAFVNRLWQAWFGTGLLETPEDFGVRASEPSHPQLLDWLAVEFMEPATLAPGEKTLAPPWDVKHIQRLIANSATYRQSSRVTPALEEKDPYNRLLARGPRFRVDAEIVRDIALSAADLINLQIGGPSVTPPAPEFIFRPPASYGPKVWVEATGPERYRRALYTFRFRSVPYPVLQTFDAPNGDFSCVRRLRSNTPLQALTTLNEVVFVECARALARETLQRGVNDKDRIVYAFRRCVGRRPSGDELKELSALLRKEEQHVGEGWVDAGLLATGKTGPIADLPKGSTPAQLAAYTVVARVLLNLDETVTQE
jgi:mono/diheme cytochrome c family protein